ncbi:MAG: methylated-DNA--[protein]-cysteine S-methyltransferase [Rikenellaceae bacterium]|nr:methylated-DNA--[protein]-cysteine S-methyltransferase [Rikenellaceae bacterium]MCL2692374.1 methylated-DNA--[protein]-cysteine S-methyltransferase [Rikenellaceae bacterium]
MEEMLKHFLYYSSPIGRLVIAADGEGYITDLTFGRVPHGAVEGETEALAVAERQLDEYFAGKRMEFELPLRPSGTSFQQNVWCELQRIPYGRTASYGQVAAAVGKPRAARAVGMANNRNPIAVIIPCHRVIGSNGALTGYAGGLEVKKRLLELENARA